jgi:hypothetical protein
MAASLDLLPGVGTVSGLLNDGSNRFGMRDVDRVAYFDLSRLGSGALGHEPLKFRGAHVVFCG